jgi:hypothetical protein
MYLVEKQIIPARTFSSFAYPIPEEVPVSIKLSYDRIVISGTDSFRMGTHTLCITSEKISEGNKVIIGVKRC